MKITMGAVVIGGSSLNYKTGSWRDQRPVIDQDSCKKCGICESVCPDSAVRQIEDLYIIDYEYCKGCGLCAHECPVEAIEMIPEDK
ncbi:MAG: 4Fe-4S binding protein [Deltaproteobacteria bacterium]|nr:4Fe-4S binding protein [Deltaproteobacteria bacterium]